MTPRLEQAPDSNSPHVWPSALTGRASPEPSHRALCLPHLLTLLTLVVPNVARLTPIANLRRPRAVCSPGAINGLFCASWRQVFACADAAAHLTTDRRARAVARSARVMPRAVRKRRGTQGAHTALLDPSPPARRCSRTTSWIYGAAPTSRWAAAPLPPPPLRAAVGPH